MSEPFQQRIVAEMIENGEDLMEAEGYQGKLVVIASEIAHTDNPEYEATAMASNTQDPKALFTHLYAALRVVAELDLGRQIRVIWGPEAPSAN